MSPPISAEAARVLGVRLGAIAFSCLWATVCTLVLEMLQGNGYAVRPEVAGLFALNIAVVWCGLLAIWAASGKLWIGAAAVASASTLVGYANFLKITLTLEPVYPSDLSYVSAPGFLSQMVGIGTIAAAAAFALLLFAAAYLTSRLASRQLLRHGAHVGQSSRRRHLVARLTVLTVAVSALGYASNFNNPGNQLRAAFDASGADWHSWSQRYNYLRNGFVGGFLYNTAVPAMSQPAGYSRATMARITRKYSALAASYNEDSGLGDTDDINVVLVLSESFSDPTQLRGVALAQDPIPFTRQLMANTASGKMLVHDVGTGTANAEFEVLTGQSLAQFAPQLQTPYQMLVPSYEEFPSAARSSKTSGGRPIAIHPFKTHMYKREAVYPILGFEKFVSGAEMRRPIRLGDNHFISDRAAFAEVRRQIRLSKAPLFVNLVTMQNHFPTGDRYPDPIDVTGVTGDAEEQAEGYARGLRHSDDAFREFVSGLRHSKERVAMIFYGDHLPPFWPAKVRRMNDDLTMRTTPFLLWANFPMSKPHLPLTSPIFLVPLMRQAVGMELSPYHALLLDLYKHVPAMGRDGYFGPNGERLSEARLSDEAASVLRDYRLVQYDLSIGKRHSQEGLFYTPHAVIASGALD